MPRITDKADLNHGTEFTVNPTASPPTVTLSAAGNLSAGSANGVVGLALYRALVDHWKSFAGRNAYQFPFAIADGPTGTMLEFREGWELVGIEYIRNCGIAYYSTSDVLTDAWASFVQLGTANDPTDQPYYLINGTVPVDFGVADEFNECIKIYENGTFDYRSSPTARFFIREPGDTYGGYDLISEQSLSSLTYRAYFIPMTTGDDNSVVTLGPSGVPYSGMSLTLGATTATINSIVYNFAEGEIDANGGTVQQVYDWFQNLLLQSTDIDSGAGTQRGDTYLGSSLSLAGGILTTSQGLVVKNIAGADASNVINIDDTGTPRQEAFIPSFTVNCVDSDGSPVNFSTSTRVLIRDTTNGSTLYNNTPGAVNSVAVSHTAGGTAALLVKIIAVNGSTSASKMIRTTSSISSSNVSINVTQEDNDLYVDMNVDGSTIYGTDMTINANKVDLDVNDANDRISLQEIYCGYQYYLSTSAGILDSEDLITANTLTAFTFDDTVEVANVKAGTSLVVTGGTATDASGTADGWLDKTQNNIFVSPLAVEGFSYSSGSGLDAGQDATLTNTNNLVNTLKSLVDDITTRLDLDATKPNTYADDGSSITNSDFTLTKSDNGDGTGTVSRS